jgi:hypothetical protein
VNFLARKFTVGRQGEQLLNEEFHKLFMALKYLNYDRYGEIEDVKAERQTDIPDHALRLKSRDDLNYVEMYRRLDRDTEEVHVYYGYPNTVEVYDEKNEVWSTLFDGYFHPASAVKPDDITNVAPYQLCIDPKNGAIMYWDASTKSWVTAAAKQLLDEYVAYSGVNFQLITDLQRVQVGDSFHYPVPYVPYGKLFSNKKFDTTYTTYNNCGVVTNGTNLAWVHVNASKLKKVDKRLIKINPDNGFINITSSSSEFYGFNPATTGLDIFGELLIRDEDFTDVISGIQLTAQAIQKYKYIYALTYMFDDYPGNEGLVIQNNKNVGGRNTVYIGDGIADQDDVALFIDGLALEQRGLTEDGHEYDIYLHDKGEGTITFMDNDDADIINEMQMTALIFPNKTHEFTISASNDIDPDTNTVEIDLGVTYSADDYQAPMVFCSGLGLQYTSILKDVELEGSHLIIKNFTLQQDEEGNDLEIYKAFIAETGTSYVSEGVLNNYRIQHESIVSEKDYVVFVNGILMTPTNGDITVGNGYIDLVNAENAQYDELYYILFEISDYDENKIGLAYDDDVSYYSIRIEDKNNAVYDDCNCAVVYAGLGDIESGILLDEAAVEKPLNPADNFYKGNQIIRITDRFGHFKYYIYDFTNDEPQELNRAEANEIEDMITYYANAGSIQLVGDNERLEGYNLKYLAYSYANMIDEPLMIGYQDNLPIKIEGLDYESLYTGNTARKHAWKMGNNSLSTYINGLIVENTEVVIDKDTGAQLSVTSGNTRNFTVKRPILDMKQSDYYGEKNLLITLKIINALYGDKTELDIRKEKAEDVLAWPVGDGLVGDYFFSVNLFIDAWKLAKYIDYDLTKEHISYVIENLERNEFVATHKDYIYLETGDKTTDHKQIYKVAADAIETDFILAPGFVNVYVNGVLLQDSEYCKFDSNKIIFNIPVCGLQQLPDNKDVCLPDYLTKKSIEEYKRLYKNEPKKIMRVIDDKPYYIPVSNRDEVLIEKRDDTSLKRITYDLEPVSYNNAGSLELTQDFYNLPESLMNSTDHIKIYINGVYYDEGYTISNAGGVKSIKLTKPGTLFIDPTYTFLYDARNVKNRTDYEQKHGVYQRRIDKITFEWR